MIFRLALARKDAAQRAVAQADPMDVLRRQLDIATGRDAIIVAVRTCARNAVGADGVTFVLREYSHCHYVEEDAIAPLWKGQRFPMTDCISGWAMLNKKTAVVPDIFQDARIPHEVYRKTFVRSLVMAPVGLDTPIASIGAYWRERPLISQRDVEAVETLAALVGEAFRRQRIAA